MNSNLHEVIPVDTLPDTTSGGDIKTEVNANLYCNKC